MGVRRQIKQSRLSKGLEVKVKSMATSCSEQRFMQDEIAANNLVKGSHLSSIESRIPRLVNVDSVSQYTGRECMPFVSAKQASDGVSIPCLGSASTTPVCLET